MNKIILRYRNIFLIALIIVVFTIIIHSVHSNYSQKFEEIKAQKAVFEKGKETLAEWSRLQEKYADLAGKFLNKDVLAFKRFVEQKARAVGISIESLDMSETDKGFYWEVSIALSTVCSYKSFSAFINSLEEKRVQFDQAQMSSKDSDVKVNLRIKGVVTK